MSSSPTLLGSTPPNTQPLASTATTTAPFPHFIPTTTTSTTTTTTPSSSHPYPLKPALGFSSKQYLVDFASAAIAGFAVSPIVSAVDQALAENAAGKATLMGSFTQSMRSIVTSPIKFMTNGAFKWVYLIYGATYFTANICKTVCSTHNKDHGFPLWLSTSVINTAACINKDYQFAKLFSSGIPRPVPPSSLGIWAIRDCTSMFSFFILPPLAAEYVQQHTGNETLSKYSAQFVVPMVFQYILTPIHRLGYDRYNNPNNSFSQSMEFLKKDFMLAAHLRMVRCIPPWVLGVTANTEIRDRLSDVFQTKVSI